MFDNPLTPMSDQDRISPYNIKQTSDENKKKNYSWKYIGKWSEIKL